MLSSLINAFKSPQATTPTAPAVVVASSRITRLSDLGFLQITDFSDRGEHNKHIKTLWKEFVKTNQPTCAQMCLRNLLLGHPADRGFSPVTSSIKLANGQTAYGSLSRALWDIETMEHAWTPWRDLWVSPQAQPTHRNRLAKIFGDDEEGVARVKIWNEFLSKSRTHVSSLSKS